MRSDINYDTWWYILHIYTLTSTNNSINSIYILFICLCNHGYFQAGVSFRSQIVFWLGFTIVFSISFIYSCNTYTYIQITGDHSRPSYLWEARYLLFGFVCNCFSHYAILEVDKITGTIIKFTFSIYLTKLMTYPTTFKQIIKLAETRPIWITILVWHGYAVKIL